jgi:hypothetical protein
MDAGSARDECAGHGRRSRSVLIPRRWYQVLEKLALLRDDGDNKARSPGRLRRKSLKPSRRECRKRFGEPVVTNSYACFICMRGCGCAKHPAFPAPSPRKRLAFVATLRDTDIVKLGRSSSRERRIMPCLAEPWRDRWHQPFECQKRPVLSFPAFGARTPPRPRPPHPWRPAADAERAAMRPLTF